jgi:hypothetical protein
VTVDDHPSFEDLSAYHDGEAPEWAAHVAACKVCQQTVAALSALTAAVAEPPSAAAGASLLGSDAMGDDPVARAVASASGGLDSDDARAAPSPSPATAPPPSPSPSRGRWLVAAAGAAAVVMVVVGLTVVLRRSNEPDSTTTAAGRPQRSELNAPESAVGGPGPAADSAATAVVGGDLGEIGDAATLLAKVAPVLSSGRSAAGEGGAGVPAAPPVRSSVPGVVDVPEPRVVGTRPCEIEARAGQPALGDVVYVATARSAEAPAVVLGFAPASGAGPVTVAMLTTSDCRLLFRATTP